MIDLSRAHTPADRITTEVTDALRATHGVAAFTPVRASPDGSILVTTLTPATGPQDAATGTLLDTLSDRTLPVALHGTGARAYLTGTVAG